jgi:hypothetical protein
MLFICQNKEVVVLIKNKLFTGFLLLTCAFSSFTFAESEELFELEDQNFNDDFRCEDSKTIFKRCRRRPTGPTGVQGPTGNQGVQGPTGNQGQVSQACGALSKTTLYCRYSGGAGNIQELGETTFTFPVIPNFQIASLQVSLSGLYNQNASNLQASVTLPDNSVINLFYNISNGANLYDGNTYTFADGGASLVDAAAIFGPIPGGTYFATNASPAHSRVSLNGNAEGKFSAGNWSLKFFDGGSGYESGVLDSWSIILNCNPTLITSNFSLAPLGDNGNQIFNMNQAENQLEILVSGDYKVSYSVFGRYIKIPIEQEIPAFIDAVVGINGVSFSNASLGSFNTVNQTNSDIQSTFGVAGSKSAILHLNAGDKIGLYLRTDETYEGDFSLTDQSISLSAVLLESD